MSDQQHKTTAAAQSTERIVAAALRTPGAVVVSVPPPGRHHDVIRHMIENGDSREQIARSEQGFVTSAGRFLGREEAWSVAAASGQIVHTEDMPDGVLYSENLW